LPFKTLPDPADRGFFTDEFAPLVFKGGNLDPGQANHIRDFVGIPGAHQAYNRSGITIP
jgi:hypothetical protein